MQSTLTMRTLMIGGLVCASRIQPLSIGLLVVMMSGAAVADPADEPFPSFPVELALLGGIHHSEVVHTDGQDEQSWGPHFEGELGLRYGAWSFDGYYAYGSMHATGPRTDDPSTFHVRDTFSDVGLRVRAHLGPISIGGGIGIVSQTTIDGAYNWNSAGGIVEGNLAYTSPKVPGCHCRLEALATVDRGFGMPIDLTSYRLALGVRFGPP